MIHNIYYTAREGRRSANGHTITRGEVYAIIRMGKDEDDKLVQIGEYSHQSGGAGIERPILDVIENNGYDTNGGYYKKWQEAINLVQI